MDPRLVISRALRFGFAYAVAAGLSVGLSRVNDGFAMFWVATAIVAPFLIIRAPRHWAGPVGGCAIASFVVTGTIGLGWTAAPFLALANCAEVLVGALILRTAYKRYGSFTSLRLVLSAFAAGGLAAPLAGAIVAVPTLVSLTDQAVAPSLSTWLTAHGLGFISLFPSVGLFAEARRRRRNVMPLPGKRRGAALALACVAAAGAVCFGQSSVPMLFLPILVLMYTMVLTDLHVSAVALLMLLAMGLASAFLGFGPLRLMAHAQADRFLFLQFYTACVSLTAMPIALMLEKRRTLYAALAESEARYKLLADFSTDIIMVTGNRGDIRYVSPSVRQLGDYEPKDLIGTKTDALIASQYQDEIARAYARVVLVPGETASVEFVGVLRGGGSRWFESHMRGILREDGGVDGVCSVIRDISQRKRREAELKAVALTDPLTSLANRRAFEMFMASASAGAGEHFIALFDLDHFKQVNDRFGHETGDTVIKAFARAARRVVRDTDLVARIGGEEFAVYLHDTTLAQARTVCERIRAALSSEARMMAPQVTAVSASAGISRFDAPLAAVMRRADAALYEAKAKGRDCLAIAA